MTADTELRAVDKAYIEAYRHTFAECERRGLPAFLDGTEDLTDEALAIALERFGDVLPGLEAAELAAAPVRDFVPALTSPSPPSGRRQRRRHFSQATLERYPLTQPPERCQRCGATDPDGLPLELDHVMELAYGGPDHPHNLIRLCGRCHRAKPLPEHLEGSFVEWRLAILVWVTARPLLRWFEPEEQAIYDELTALLQVDRLR